MTNDRILKYISLKISQINEVLETVATGLDNFIPKAVTSDTVRRIVTLTQAEYDALETKDPNVEYNIIEA